MQQATGSHCTAAFMTPCKVKHGRLAWQTAQYDLFVPAALVTETSIRIVDCDASQRAGKRRHRLGSLGPRNEHMLWPFQHEHGPKRSPKALAHEHRSP